MNKTTIVQSFSQGSKLTKTEWICIASFLHHGHEFHLYSYDPKIRAPLGTIVIDANTIISSKALEEIAFNEHQLACLFKYFLLIKRGGWWSSLAVFCLKHLDFENDYVFASSLEDKTNRRSVSKKILKVPQKSQLIKDCLNVMLSDLWAVRPENNYEETVFSTQVFRKNLMKYIEPSNTFCPFLKKNDHTNTGSTNPPSGLNSYSAVLWSRNISVLDDCLWKDIVEQILLKNSFDYYENNDNLDVIKNKLPKADFISEEISFVLAVKIGSETVQKAWINVIQYLKLSLRVAKVKILEYGSCQRLKPSDLHSNVDYLFLGHCRTKYDVNAAILDFANGESTPAICIIRTPLILPLQQFTRILNRIRAEKHTIYVPFTFLKPIDDILAYFFFKDYDLSLLENVTADERAYPVIKDFLNNFVCSKEFLVAGGLEVLNTLTTISGTDRCEAFLKRLKITIASEDGFAFTLISSKYKETTEDKFETMNKYLELYRIPRGNQASFK